MKNIKKAELLKAKIPVMPSGWPTEDETLYTTNLDETNVTTSIAGLEPIEELPVRISVIADILGPPDHSEKINEVIRKVNKLMEITNASLLQPRG